MELIRKYVEPGPVSSPSVCFSDAEKLKERRHHKEAALLLEQYAEDVEEAIVTLINGHVWQDALRLVRLLTI